MAEHKHTWIYGDLGYHWCKDSGCGAHFHDFPCDYPEEHDNDE